MGGALRKRLENRKKQLVLAEYVPMKGKRKGFFTTTDRGSPYEKGWKITKETTCVYEGEFVHMKGKVTVFD